MDTIYKQEEDKDEGITLDSEPLTPDQPNPGQEIDSYDEMETTETLMEDYKKIKDWPQLS